MNRWLTVVGKRNKLANKSIFLERLAVLLKEGYTFHEGLILLLPHHVKNYEEEAERVQEDLKSGYGVTAILKNLGFEPEMLLPVVIAEVNGKLIEALEELARRMKAAEERKKKLKKMLAYPAVLFFILGILLIAFRQFFLPNFQALAVARSTGGQGIAEVLPRIVAAMPDVMLTGMAGSALVAGVMHWQMKKWEPAIKLNRLLKLPFFGAVFLLMKTRDFSNELGGLLQSGLSMQRALSVLADQQFEPLLAEIAKNVRKFVVFGEPFHEAVKLTEGLAGQLAVFAKHGSDSGYLPKELLLYSDHLNEMIDTKVSKWISFVQPLLFGILACCILLAYLAILLPVYQMIDGI